MSFALNAVYNNYLTAYAPKTLTRYDTHKESELRSVYSAIVRLNKDAPWYLPTTSRDTQKYAVDLKENARELKNTIAQLGGLEEDGLFSKKSAFSSDEEVATVSYIGSADAKEEIPQLQLEVKKLASAQENLGLFLPDEKADLTPATYSFDVAINDMNYEFQFSVNESENNREIQERLVRLINSSGIGIRADLVESDGRTALRMCSETTGLPQGREQIFSVSDSHTSKTAGTVEYFGLDYTSRAASDASLTIDGMEQHPSSNRFTIGGQFEVTLKGISEEGTVTRIGLKTDIESLADNMGHLISGYNDFLQAAASYLESQSGSRHLVSELKAIASSYESSLEPLGFTMSEDGSLHMNRNLLHQAAEQSESISDTFGTLRSFSSALLHKSNQVSINPMNYVQKTVVAYKNPGHTYFSPYNTSAYSGMMFNSYC